MRDTLYRSRHWRQWLDYGPLMMKHLNYTVSKIVYKIKAYKMFINNCIYLHLYLSSKILVQKNSKPENVDFSQQDYVIPERTKRRGPSTPAANTVIHTISRRQTDMMEMQVNVMNDIARTFNTCVCGVPPIPEKGT